MVVRAESPENITISLTVNHICGELFTIITNLRYIAILLTMRTPLHSAIDDGGHHLKQEVFCD